MCLLGGCREKMERKLPFELKVLEAALAESVNEMSTEVSISVLSLCYQGFCAPSCMLTTPGQVLVHLIGKQG
jgi:hypothetical protein